MVTSKNGAAQVIEAATACLAQISLSIRLCVVEPLLNYLLRIAFGTMHSLMPPDSTDDLIAFICINKGLNIHQHSRVLAHPDTPTTFAESVL